MIEIKPTYRVRLVNALDYCGYCAIDLEVQASTAAELQDRIAEFMESIGVQSADHEIFRLSPPDPLTGIHQMQPYLIGVHWRAEEIGRVEDHHG